MRVMDELSGEELADRSGVTAEQLRRLVELGIITPTPQDRYRPSDIQRIRVVHTLADAGFAPEQLSQLIATGAYNLDWASVVFPEPTAQLTTTLEQTAAATGLPQDLVARLFDAWELPRPQPGQALRADDDELLHLAVPALEGFGRDETALLGAARQLGDSLRGLAESQVRLFHAHVEERLAAEGHPDHSWSDDLNQVAASMMASLECTLILLYRRHFEHYVLDVTVLRAEAALERAARSSPSSERGGGACHRIDPEFSGAVWMCPPCPWVPAHGRRFGSAGTTATAWTDRKPAWFHGVRGQSGQQWPVSMVQEPAAGRERLAGSPVTRR
jgi:DNA-binding transcriptional MerR regulator